MRKALATLGIAALGTVPVALPAQAPAAPIAQASKYCSKTAEGYGDRNARTPGGEKCLGVGEYCSHKRGYAKAYREAGFRCNSSGRLERR
jgi:hypothetical protein